MSLAFFGISQPARCLLKIWCQDGRTFVTKHLGNPRHTFSFEQGLVTNVDKVCLALMVLKSGDVRSLSLRFLGRVSIDPRWLAGFLPSTVQSPQLGNSTISCQFPAKQENLIFSHRFSQLPDFSQKTDLRSEFIMKSSRHGCHQCEDHKLGRPKVRVAKAGEGTELPEH